MAPTYRVLIIDDDPAYVKSTQLVLESHGYQVDSASSGDEALARMQAQKPDVVLLDIIMDWALDGVHVTREMLRQKGLSGIPIIIVSSIVDSEYRDYFPQDEYLHFDAWLDKPCAPADLAAKVQEVLVRYEKHRESTGES
jgi:CheY-like chemotaxis protein